MSTPSSPSLQQFLSNVLSQRGPSSLPYNEDVKYLIRQHLITLTDTYPSLQSKTATFTHNDGRTVNLLQADGTIPMIYNDVTYNIPIIIWLLESYPRQSPLVFVNPTRDMIIKRQHPFVNPSGVVSIPYIDNWIYPSSNLVELCRNMSHFFGRDPPLYSRPNPSPNPIPNPSGYATSSSSFEHGDNRYSSGNSMSYAARPAIPPRPYAVSPYGLSSGGGGKYMDDQEEVFRRNAMNKLVENLHADIVDMRRAREGEMEGLFNGQAVLRQREGELFKGVKEMKEEKERLENQLQMMMVNGDALEGWLRENEKKVEVLRNVDVDDAFEHCDGLSKQMFECTASDLGLEDVIYALDKAVQDGAVPFDQYLRNVRMLSREQFIYRATGSKVRAAQMQAQVANMASRAPAYTL